MDLPTGALHKGVCFYFGYTVHPFFGVVLQRNRNITILGGPIKKDEHPYMASHQRFALSYI